MAVSAADITAMMIALLPHGDAWPCTTESNFGQLMQPYADEFARISSMHDVVFNEMSTHTTAQMLDEYELDYGLPDCVLDAQTTLQRLNALMIKDDLVGGQDRQFFIDLAAQLGYAITIAEFNEANPGPPTAFQGVPLAGQDWNFVWQITADTNITPRGYGSQYNERYSNTNSELLECTLRAYAHDHRVLLFNFI